MSLIFCPQCGTENEETNHECRACAYDFMSGSVLICPICQYENHPLLDKCKQCGTDLTAVSAVSDPESEDAQADLARITGPLPAPPTRKFTPGGNSENQSQAKESENFDTWLDEVISGKSDDEFGGDSEDETPIWAVGSGLSLGDTMELEEESLPDWLKSLKEADEDKEEEPAAAPERKMAGWLDESKLAQLGVTKDLEGEASDSPQSEKEIQNQRQVEQKSENGGQYTGARSAAVTAPLSPEALELQEEQEVDDSSDQQDNWLVELAAMGSVSDSRDEEDEEDTRFVWDESALSSDVGEKAPGWLKELTESEDWPNTISESVIEEWTQKIDDDLVEADDPKRFVTRPLGHTKELDGVPERLVSPALPEWLGDKSEEPSLPIPLEEEITDEFDGAEIEDAEIEDAEIEDEEPFLVLSDWRDSAEDTLEDTQEIALSGLPELQTEKEDLEMESEPVVEVEDSWDIETPELASALSGTVVEQPVISDDWLDDLAEAEDLIDHRELEPISAIDELLIEDQPVEDSDVVELETADQDIDEQPKVEDVDEVPTWLARLTTKLLDTFDNDFVNEWFSKDKDKDGETIEKVQDESEPVTSKEEAKSDVEQESAIDPFFGEAIPAWLRQSEAEGEIIQDDDSLGGTIEAPVLASFEEQEIVKKDKDKYAALIAAGAVASSDEWLNLLERQEVDDVSAAETEEAELVPEDFTAAPVVQTESSPEEIEDELVKAQQVMATDVFEEELPGPIGVAATDAYLIPDIEASESSDVFTVTREQRHQVTLLKQLTSAEPREARPVGGQAKATIAPNLRIILALLLLLLILIGWLIPTSLDPIEGLIQPTLIGSESDVYEAIQEAAGRPVLVAFEYTPAMAGELDVVATPLLNQMAENGSPVISVSQIAAGTAMAEKMLDSVEDIESYNLGFLPGEAIGLRRLALCLTGEDSCETIFGQPLNEETVEALKDFALILVLAGDRDAIINWIEQVGPSVDQELVAGIIQPLQPVVAPYVNSDQLAGIVPGAQSALAYQQLLRGNDSSVGIKLSALTLAFWFTAVVLIVGSIYYSLKGSSPPSEGEEAAR